MTPSRTLRGHRGGTCRVCEGRACESKGVCGRGGWRETGRTEPSFTRAQTLPRQSKTKRRLGREKQRTRKCPSKKRPPLLPGVIGRCAGAGQA